LRCPARQQVLTSLDVLSYSGSSSLWPHLLGCNTSVFRLPIFRPFRISALPILSVFRFRFSAFSRSVFRSDVYVGCSVFGFSDCSVFGASAPTRR
jgi:hypothetical protein